ncbi:MAG: 2,5-diamino-6-(ribosylamino)-4(3H)-pyrimidinone 5'-phosphate reductase [Anaerolineales bacterium]|nr:2,5-diamino-6-(ribosylamino)-4(3H)-pyrimidinone 5'-phosphate reductase [Anaerolineales bacterium]
MSQDGVYILEFNMHSRPYVTLNVAMTADGKTDTITRTGTTISSADDLLRVDQLRAQNDAVMVGGHTLLGDDPRLTVKSDFLRSERLSQGQEESPIKVGVVTNAAIQDGSRFLTVGNERKIIFTTTQTDAAQIDWLKKQDVQVFVADRPRVDLDSALQQLKQLGVERLLVEGGGTLNEDLLKHNLVDEINVYIAPLIFGGANAPTFVSGTGFERQHALQLKLTAVDQHSDGGILLCYLVETSYSGTNSNH